MFYLGFEFILAEAVASPVHVEFAEHLVGSDVVLKRLDRHRYAQHSVEHQFELGNVLVLSANDLDSHTRTHLHLTKLTL